MASIDVNRLYFCDQILSLVGFEMAIVAPERIFQYIRLEPEGTKEQQVTVGSKDSCAHHPQLAIAFLSRTHSFIFILFGDRIR